MSISYLATTTLAVSVLILAVLLVRGPVARRFGPNAAYALWLLPALRLVMPPLPASVSPLSWLGFAPGGTDAAVLSPLTLERTSALRVTPSSPTPEHGAWASNPLAAGGPAPAPMPAPGPAEPGMDGMGSLLATAPWALIAVAALLASIAVYYALILFRQARFSRLVAMEAEPASDDVAQVAETVRRSLGIRRQVRVKTSFLPSSPMVMGALRPTIVVPAWFELDYTPNEQRLALVHEMAHIKRGDLWALHAAHFLLALQWFNPLAHVALRAFRADQEAACDALVLARSGTSPHAYGATLLKAIKLMRPAPQLQVAGLTLDHGLKERFQRMGWEGRQVSWIGKATAAATGALLIMASASTVAAHDEGETLLGGQRSVFVETSPDGKRVVRIDKRERMLLSDDPFEAMHEELAKLDTIHDDLPPPGAITAPPPDPPVPPVPGEHALNLALDLGDLEGKFVFDNLADLGDLAALGALGALADEDFEIITSPDGQSITITGDGLHLSVTGFDEATFEAGMEDFEARMEAFEAEMDAYAEAIEAEAERYAAKIEARVEAVTSSDAFEKATEDGETVVEDLSDICHDKLEGGATLALAETTAPHSGKAFQAICIDDKADVTGDEIDDFIDAQPGLSEAERDALKTRR